MAQPDPNQPPALVLPVRQVEDSAKKIQRLARDKINRTAKKGSGKTRRRKKRRKKKRRKTKRRKKKRKRKTKRKKN